jgi:hypothetical protein
MVWGVCGWQGGRGLKGGTCCVTLSRVSAPAGEGNGLQAHHDTRPQSAHPPCDCGCRTHSCHSFHSISFQCGCPAQVNELNTYISLKKGYSSNESARGELLAGAGSEAGAGGNGYDGVCVLYLLLLPRAGVVPGLGCGAAASCQLLVTGYCQLCAWILCQLCQQCGVSAWQANPVCMQGRSVGSGHCRRARGGGVSEYAGHTAWSVRCSMHTPEMHAATGHSSMHTPATGHSSCSVTGRRCIHGSCPPPPPPPSHWIQGACLILAALPPPPASPLTRSHPPPVTHTPAGLHRPAPPRQTSRCLSPQV